MPELPEVETVVQDLIQAGLRGKTICGAHVSWPRTIAVPGHKTFCRRIRGQTIEDISRRGKFIVVHFSSGTCLLIHLRMTGRLHLVAPAVPISRHEHVVLQLHDSSHLRFHDTRKFGRMHLTASPADILGGLGPEPLTPSFSAAVLDERVRTRSRLLKPLLLDQTVIAGLGNIYVDEALWAARLHPCRISSTLTDSEIRTLHRAIPSVLQKAVRNLGTTLGSGKTNFYSVAQNRGRNREQLNVFRRTGLPCPRCRTEIRRIIVGQRSTHLCPACQNAP